MEEYSEDKWKAIMSTTQSNYANMLKRLNRKLKMSNYILIYYSIFLITSALTTVYFPEIYNYRLSGYFCIITSVVVLAYSLVNNNANYATRIVSVLKSLNEIKTIKRQISSDPDEMKKLIEKYNQVVDGTEVRQDADFFITVRNLCEEHQINWKSKKRRNDIQTSSEGERINNYLSEINVAFEQSRIVVEWIWYALVFIVPIILFVVPFIIS